MAATAIDLPQPPLDPEWTIGDQVLAAVADGADLLAAKIDAARRSRRELQDVTLIVSVCRAFPVEQRHPALTFGHHAAVTPLPVDQQGKMQDRAATEGWSARKLRGEVLRHRVATGDVTRLGDDDPEDAAFRKLARAWNHAPIGAREMLSTSIEDDGLSDILL